MVRPRLLPTLVQVLLAFWTSATIAADKTPKAAVDAENPPSTIEIVVNDQQGRPIDSGTAQLRGTTEFGNFFYRSVPIKQGKAIVALKTNRIDEMVLTLESRGQMSFEKQYLCRANEPCVVFAPRDAFQLASGIKIGGKVVDVRGKPIAQAKVLVTSKAIYPTEQGQNFCWRTELTDAEGHWELSGAPPDLAGLELDIERNAYKTLSVPKIISAADQANLKAFKDVRTLELAPVYSGVVVDPEGKPVSGAMVLVCDRIGDYFSEDGDGLIPRTDAAGMFHLPGVLPGNHVLGIFSPDWDLKMVSVSLPAAGTVTPWKIALKKGKRVEFRTRNAKGEPISGIKFFPLARSKRPSAEELNMGYAMQYLTDRNFIPARSDEHGVFVWQNAPDELLEYQFSSPRILSPPRGNFGPAGSPHTLIFRESIPLTAKVVDADTGRPILSYKLYEGMHIKGNRSENWDWHLHGSSKVRPGQFADSLMSLNLLIQYRIEAHGYRPGLSDIFDAEKLPSAPISIEFRLEKDAGYAGRIVGPDGKPAAGAKVYAQIKRPGVRTWLKVVNGAADESKMATADAEGRVRLAPVDGPYVCFVSHNMGYAQMMDVDLSRKTEIKLTPWATVEGELRIHGKPASHVFISFDQRDFRDLHSEMPAVAQIKSLRTDAEGKYRFEHCIAGRWRESIVYDETGRPRHVAYQQNLTVDLVAGQTVRQLIGAEGTNLAGRFVLPKGADLSRSSVHLAPLNESPGTEAGKSRPNETVGFQPSRQSIELKADGTFQFFNLEPAEQRLFVSIPLIGDAPSQPKYSKQINIPREMFAGKTTRDSIDLGEITLKLGSR